MKSVVKNLLAKLNIKIINLRYRLRPFVEEKNILSLNFDHVISNYILNEREGNAFNFIQIGAFDGIMRDPIRKFIVKYNWSGIMVEPQPGPFSKLRALYSNNKNITLLNCVISDSAKKQALYVIDGSNSSLPDWICGSASFDRNNLVKFKDVLPDIESFVREIFVDSITMDELLRINGAKQVDLLQIDAEGYDGELIKLFPFDRIKPKIIHFECKNLNKPDLEFVLDKLISINYEVAFDGGQNKAEDMIAVLMEPNDQLNKSN